MKKITTVGQISSIAKQLKLQGKSLVLAGGCFDILHIGHTIFLEKSKNEGQVLILLLESDDAIRNLKGEGRPINSQKKRAQVLRAIEFVDFIVPLPAIYKNSDYEKIVTAIKPNVIAVTAGDINLEKKRKQAKQVGGKLRVVLKKIPEHSTTKLLGYF